MTIGDKSTDADRPVYVEKTTKAVEKDFIDVVQGKIDEIAKKSVVNKADMIPKKDDTMKATLEYNKALKKNILPLMTDAKIPKRHFFKALYIYYITMGETIVNALKLANPGKYKDADVQTCYRQGRMIEGEIIYQNLYNKICENKIDFASRLGGYEEKIVEAMVKRLEEEGDEMKPMARNQLEANLLTHIAKRKEMKQKQDERINVNINTTGPTQIQVVAPSPNTDNLEDKSKGEVLETVGIVVQVEEENVLEDNTKKEVN